MKILLAAIIVMALARLISVMVMGIFGLVMVIPNLLLIPLGSFFEQWRYRVPHVMRGLRFRIKAIVMFTAMFFGVAVTVIFSYYIFHIVAHTTSGGVIQLVSVTIPMLFSVRADLKDWKKNYAVAWSDDHDVSDEVRKNVDSEIVMIHRVGVFAKACGIIAAWLYFLLIGDQIILPYLGIK